MARKSCTNSFKISASLLLFLLIIYFCLGCTGSSLLHGLCFSCGEWGCSLVVVHGLLLAGASLVAGHRLQVLGLKQLWQVGSAVAAPGLLSTGLVVVVHELSCSMACGIFPDQGSNLCLLHWEVDSLPYSHEGSPSLLLLIKSST